MTVPTTTNKVIADGNSVATVFPFTFGTLPSGDLVVSLFDSEGTEYPQVENTDYTVQGKGADDGGSITFVSPPISGYKVLIQRILPITQPTDLKNQGSFYPRTVERMSDRSTFIDQQIKERVDASMTLPAQVENVSTELPVPEPNTLFGWNPAGTAVQNFPLDTLATNIAYGDKNFQVFAGTGAQQDFILSRDPGSLGNLDVSIDGVTQVNGTDFTYSGTTLTLIPAPANGAVILVRFDVAVPIGTSLASSAQFQALGTSVIRTVQQKLREFVSITDYGAEDNGIFDNLGAYVAAKAALVSGGRMRFPKVTSTGTYYMSGSPDFTGVVFDVDEGVTIKANASFPSSLKVSKDTRLLFPSINIDYRLTKEMKKPWAEKNIWLSDRDKDDSYYLALSTTSDITNESIDFLTGDTFTAAAATPLADSVFWSQTDTTKLFLSRVLQVRPGDEVSAAFATGGLYTRVAFIQTTAGYHMVTAQGDTTCVYHSKLTGGAASSNNFDYEGRTTHASYYPENGVWSIRIYNRGQFGVLFNGVEATNAQTANGDIVRVGFGWVPSATVTQVSITGWARLRKTQARAKRGITVLCHGDSMTEDLHGAWPYYMREALDGTSGIRVNNVINMAVGGQTSTQQRASLLANGVQGAQFTFICVGTNDIQGGVAPATTVSNISDMIDFCATNGSTPIVWIPPLWYPNSLVGGNGQNTANYQAGAHTRSLIARLAGTKGIRCLDMTQAMGQILATYKTGETAFGYDPMVRDNIHPTAYGYRLIGRELARVLMGAYVPEVTELKGSTFLPASGVRNGWLVAIQPPRYTISVDGVVNLNGVIDGNTGTKTDGTAIYNLPEFLRPITNCRFLCATDDTKVAKVTVQTGGDILVSGVSAGNIWVALDSLSFKTAN